MAKIQAGDVVTSSRTGNKEYVVISVGGMYGNQSWLEDDYGKGWAVDDNSRLTVVHEGTWELGAVYQGDENHGRLPEVCVQVNEDGSAETVWGSEKGYSWMRTTRYPEDFKGFTKLEVHGGW